MFVSQTYQNHIYLDINIIFFHKNVYLKGMYRQMKYDIYWFRFQLTYIPFLILELLNKDKITNYLLLKFETKLYLKKLKKN